ncbi:MAG: 4Fe-4S dicluster domain-containing protein [Planctomycetes bacterium]|nr:4Fe-4S dicluster domain-containing protein [Planctomycetota bacterium]NOG54530.1 4Fe-4S dicluster domain-containing protein [Planctomycetota bacterium]
MGASAVVGACVMCSHFVGRLLSRRQHGAVEGSAAYPAVRAKRAVWESDGFVIRPPGALESDEDFLAACIRCYRCQDACEPGSIRFFGDGAGPSFHSPFIDPSVKGCTLCMKCTTACPTQALADLTWEQRGEVRMATVELREDLCLSYKAKRIRDEQALLMELGREATEASAMYERRGPCGECYAICPRRRHAIRLEPGGFLAPIVNEEECVGCGMCEEICRAVVRGEPAIRVVPTRRIAGAYNGTHSKQPQKKEVG